MKILILCSALLLSSCHAQDENFYDIIIVGAGAAGISAAKQVLSDPGKSFRVLEARSRAGGRIYSDNSLNYTVDMGISSILPGSNIRNVIESFNMPVVDQQFTSIGPGSMTTTRERCLDASQAIIGTSTTVYATSGAPDQNVNITANTQLQKLSANKNQTWCMGLKMQYEAVVWGADADKISTIYRPVKKSGSALVSGVVPGGIGQLLSSVNDGYLRDAMVYNSPVTKITYNTTTSKVTIVTSSKTYQCTQVIVAVPLGVLKSGSIVFEPPLPESQTNAIQALGNGNLLKIFLECKGGSDIETPIPNFGQAFYYPNQTFETAVPGPYSYQYIDLTALNKTGISVTIGGSAALSTRSNQQLAQDAFNRLRSVYPQLTLVDYRVKRWDGSDNDSYSLGSGYYPAVGVPASAIAAASMNSGSTLYFAGEYASNTDAGSIIGAWETGLLAGKNALAKVGALGKNVKTAGVSRAVSFAGLLWCLMIGLVL